MLDFSREVLRSQIPVALIVTIRDSKLCTAAVRELLDTAVNFHSRIKFFQIDADEEKALRLALNVGAVPSLLIFTPGKEVTTLLGFHYKEELDIALRKSIPTESEG